MTRLTRNDGTWSFAVPRLALFFIGCLFRGVPGRGNAATAPSFFTAFFAGLTRFLAVDTFTPSAANCRSFFRNLVFMVHVFHSSSRAKREGCLHKFLQLIMVSVASIFVFICVRLCLFTILLVLFLFYFSPPAKRLLLQLGKHLRGRRQLRACVRAR